MPPSKKPDDDILRSLQETAIRLDEKIKAILDKHDLFAKSDEKLDEKTEKLKNELQELRTTLNNLSDKLKFVGGIWEKIFDDAWKLALTVIGAAILYILGFQSK